MTIWIVDYDLPADNRRRRFYRAIAGWLAKNAVTRVTRWSTQSVVITDSQEFAQLVYQEANQLGVAHLYKAVMVK